MNDAKLKAELIEIYSLYIKNPDEPSLKTKANKAYADFIGKSSVLDKDTAKAVILLVDIGYEEKSPTRPSKKLAQDILKKLKA